MKNQLAVFENEQFGRVRTVVKAGEPYFVGKDVAEILGYSNPRKAMADHVEIEDKTDGVTIRDAMGREQNPILINESGLYSLVFASKLPTAKKFKRWVTHEVIPAIRKTGSYSVKKSTNEEAQTKRLEIMERNSKIRAASLLLKIAERTSIPEYKEVCNAQAASLAAGRELLPLPVVEKPTYSATDIGKMFNVSANKIGKLANEHGLKTAEYGKLFYSKSEHSCKEVETWRYYDSVIPVLENILGRKAVAA